jgi:hypothetical protein
VLEKMEIITAKGDLCMKKLFALVRKCGAIKRDSKGGGKGLYFLPAQMFLLFDRPGEE